MISSLSISTSSYYILQIILLSSLSEYSSSFPNLYITISLSFTSYKSICHISLPLSTISCQVLDPNFCNLNCINLLIKYNNICTLHLMRNNQIMNTKIRGINKFYLLHSILCSAKLIYFWNSMHVRR